MGERSRIYRDEVLRLHAAGMGPTAIATAIGGSQSARLPYIGLV